MRLRWTLILLVVGAVLPVAAFAIYVASLVLDQEQQQFVAAVQARNRAFMSAVDTELAGQIETLRAVAASLNLDREDLRGFHAEAVAILETQHEWENLVLNAPDGAQLVNAVLPFGSPLPRGDAQSTVRVVQTGSPMVVDLRIRPITSTLAIPIRVPIVRKGRIRYVLTAVVRTSVFQHLLEKQELPKGWITGLADGENHFIARLPPRPTGSSVSRDFAAAIANAREGWYRGRTAEGVDTFTAFAKASLANWSIGVAIPSETVLASQHRAAVLMTSAGLVVLLVAGAIAFYVGRGISSPIATLAKAVEHLDKGPAIAVRTRIQEIRDLAAAMRRAAAGVADRQRLAAHERKLLADADRAKDEFLAMLSHELRNPLAAIVTASQLLKMAQPGSDVALSASDIIERQTRQMRRLVDDLLDVSSLVVGKATFEATVLDAADVVQEVMNQWRLSGRLEKHAVSVQVDSPVWVRADAGRLEQIVSNLLDNAVKYTPPGKAIHVEVGKDGSQAKIEISDQGIGIPPEHLEQIFRLFVQGEQDLSRSRGGMGIGLAVVRRLVELHGGTITPHSDGPGAGSRFVVRLPLARAPDMGQAAATVERDTVCARVLLVEDNDDVRAAVAELIRAFGHEVRIAANATQGLDTARTRWPDCALIDIGLPDMSGYELAQRIREVAPDMHLVAMTGYGQTQDKQRSASAGFDLHLTKPVPGEALQKLLARVGVGAAKQVRSQGGGC